MAANQLTQANYIASACVCVCGCIEIHSAKKPPKTEIDREKAKFNGAKSGPKRDGRAKYRINEQHETKLQ